MKNIFDTCELEREATVAKFASVQKEGDRQITRELEYFNLDAIISVGYRVNSIRGTQFRIWATKHLKEFLIKGFVLDDDRLKESGGGNYFDELLKRIRDIRSSEKVFWRKVLEIYATSIDYDPNVEITKDFFTQVQNKMHWAAHGHTAAEIIYERVDSKKDNLGLTTWSGDRLHSADILIAKNYLNEEELDTLNRIVTMYLEFAELQALDRKPMHMRDWIEKLDGFLQLSDRDILKHRGVISHEDALLKARMEYETYRRKRMNDPTPVELHFIEAENEVKLLQSQKKSE